MLPPRERGPVGDSRPAQWRDRAAGKPGAGRQARVTAGSCTRAPLRRDTRRGLPAQKWGAVNGPLPVRFLHSRATRHQKRLVQQVAAVNSEAAPLPLDLIVLAKRHRNGYMRPR